MRPLPLLVLGIAALSPAKDRMAILQPSTTAIVVLGSDKSTNTVQEPAKRVIPKLVREAREKLRWRDVELVPYDEVVAAQNAVLGEAGQQPTSATRVRVLDRIALDLKARYVVSTVVRELTSYRAVGVVARKGGRATIHVLVYDAQEKRYVWEDDRSETSIREQWFGNEGLAAMQEQALFNAWRKCLDPFVIDGARKTIATPTMKLVAKATSVSKDGKTVVLDLGSASGLAVGDELTSLDGTARIRVTEVLENGILCELVMGIAVKDDVFRSGR